jgi:tetratricopeptide (TPR) repeat protein
MFSFAWDNLGICYRKTDQYDEALKAYRKSIVANPQGRMPWQNIAVVYEFQKEYQKAIDAYQQLSLLDKDNPEVFYGIGRIYIFKLQDYEKGLDNICTAYRIYETQKSPFRSDAETIIGHVYSEMKKQGKDKRFYEILKAHNISTN